MAPIAIPRNVRYVSCVHDADDHPGDAHWLKRLSRLGERWRADEFVTFSSTVRTALTAKRFVGNRAVHSSVHGVFGPLASRVRDNSSRADQTPVVGFLGRLGKYKGLDLLCESVGMLRADGFDVRGTIFGSGPESALAATALGKNCEWNIGWIKDEDIPSILDSFDVLALPYREASQSGVLAYALSRGVPVVSTPVGGLVEQISETSCGLVSRSVSPEDFAASLTQLLEDKRLQHDCASNALKAAQTTHAWSRVGDDFASWFSSKT
nr:glycosyltransferase [Arthrobacter ulcerisalmonis]